MSCDPNKRPAPKEESSGGFFSWFTGGGSSSSSGGDNGKCPGGCGMDKCNCNCALREHLKECCGLGQLPPLITKNTCPVTVKKAVCEEVVVKPDCVFAPVDTTCAPPVEVRKGPATACTEVEEKKKCSMPDTDTSTCIPSWVCPPTSANMKTYATPVGVVVLPISSKGRSSARTTGSGKCGQCGTVSKPGDSAQPLVENKNCPMLRPRTCAPGDNNQGGGGKDDSIFAKLGALFSGKATEFEEICQKITQEADSEEDCNCRDCSKPKKIQTPREKIQNCAPKNSKPFENPGCKYEDFVVPPGTEAEQKPASCSSGPIQTDTPTEPQITGSCIDIENALMERTVPQQGNEDKDCCCCDITNEFWPQDWKDANPNPKVDCVVIPPSSPEDKMSNVQNCASELARCYYNKESCSRLNAEDSVSVGDDDCEPLVPNVRFPGGEADNDCEPLVPNIRCPQTALEEDCEPLVLNVRFPDSDACGLPPKKNETVFGPEPNSCVAAIDPCITPEPISCTPVVKTQEICAPEPTPECKPEVIAPKPPNRSFLDEICKCRSCVEERGGCFPEIVQPPKSPCGRCGENRGENDSCPLCRFVVNMRNSCPRKEVPQACPQPEAEDCDCDRCAGDICNSDVFDENPKTGLPIYEGGMCLTRTNYFLWKNNPGGREDFMAFLYADQGTEEVVAGEEGEDGEDECGCEEHMKMKVIYKGGMPLDDAEEYMWSKTQVQVRQEYANL